MGIFALEIEHPLDMTVQRSHDPNPRHHRRTAAATKQQNFNRRLPFRQVGFLFRQAGDVCCCVRNVTSFSPARRRYRIFELASPALFALCHLLALGHPIRGGWAEQGVRQIRSYLIRCTSMASQAFSASANVLKGDPPTLMAVLLKLMGRQEATKPGCPWSPGPLLLSLLITNE